MLPMYSVFVNERPVLVRSVSLVVHLIRFVINVAMSLNAEKPGLSFDNVSADTTPRASGRFT